MIDSQVEGIALSFSEEMKESVGPGPISRQTTVEPGLAMVASCFFASPNGPEYGTQGTYKYECILVVASRLTSPECPCNWAWAISAF